ncbi:transketolase [Nocardiopsis sp. Huas11]|uniref:transketolase family protein n=1 Tax=Nocardiopsis sp. Huas11 TaxID=2183912 RepID=UPI000EB06E7F|nr:transketolase C-terminal domain-containing protein [Nocardiopsis sp. Huas11]RKS08413.1 transketolase [Nocardiopsis sp. Huas11]
MGSPTGTRQAYQELLPALLRRLPSAVCLDTDTGMFQTEDFTSTPDRYLDLGIAEHTALAAAAGMAASGWRPYVHTMAAFAASRAAEAVKIDIAYPRLPVHIIATHGGSSAGHLGPTHQALEDLAIMRAMPGMCVLVPADGAAVEALLAQAAALPGPVYLRLGRKSTPPLAPDVPPPVLGRLQPMRRGDRVVVVCSGPHAVRHALGAAEELACEDVDVGVVQAHTIKPFDTAGLVERVRHTHLVVTVEDHWRSGGLGSVVAETLSEHTPRPLVRLGVADSFATAPGTEDELLARQGLDTVGITARLRKALARQTTL